MHLVPNHVNSTSHPRVSRSSSLARGQIRSRLPFLLQRLSSILGRVFIAHCAPGALLAASSVTNAFSTRDG